MPDNVGVSGIDFGVARAVRPNDLSEPPSCGLSQATGSLQFPVQQSPFSKAFGPSLGQSSPRFRVITTLRPSVRRTGDTTTGDLNKWNANASGRVVRVGEPCLHVLPPHVLHPVWHAFPHLTHMANILTHMDKRLVQEMATVRVRKWQRSALLLEQLLTGADRHRIALNCTAFYCTAFYCTAPYRIAPCALDPAALWSLRYPTTRYPTHQETTQPLASHHHSARSRLPHQAVSLRSGPHAAGGG